MSLAEECGLVDLLDGNPEFCLEEDGSLPLIPLARCECPDDPQDGLCEACKARNDWATWVVEDTARRRGSWVAA